MKYRNEIINKMKKIILIVIILIYSFDISAQNREKYSFVSTFDLKDSSSFKIHYYREYIIENLFIDSIFIRDGAIYKKNEKNEWFIKDGIRWILFFNEEGNSNYVKTDENLSTVLQFKKTKLYCNDSPVYYATLKSPDENCLLVDFPVFYFTPKDGFIIITKWDFFYIREDIIPCFIDYVKDDQYLDMRSMPFFD